MIYHAVSLWCHSTLSVAQPLTVMSNKATFFRPNGVHHRGSRARTLCPRHRVSGWCQSESCRASRVRRARSRRARGGACRVVASERARPAAIGRPPRRPAQPSLDVSNSCFCESI